MLHTARKRARSSMLPCACLDGVCRQQHQCPGISEGFTIALRPPDQYSVVYVNTGGVLHDPVTARGIIKLPQVCLSLMP